MSFMILSYLEIKTHSGIYVLAIANADWFGKRPKDTRIRILDKKKTWILFHGQGLSRSSL